jgi:hypothetical protein
VKKDFCLILISLISPLVGNIKLAYASSIASTNSILLLEAVDNSLKVQPLSCLEFGAFYYV